MTCTCTLVLEADSLTCYLEDGHAGPHKDTGEGGPVWWQYA